MTDPEFGIMMENRENEKRLFRADNSKFYATRISVISAIAGFLTCALIGVVLAMFFMANVDLKLKKIAENQEMVLSKNQEAIREILLDRLHSILNPVIQTSEDTRPSTYLAVIILSTPTDAKLRQTIRSTWLQLSRRGPKQVRHYFVMGTKGLPDEEVAFLRRENSDYNDLILLKSLKEDYGTLTTKLLAAMEAVEEKLKFSFLLKVDSDSFVRLDALLKSLRDISYSRLYWGFMDGSAEIRSTGKLEETDWNLCDRYLPYALGGGYVLNEQLVNYIVKNKDLLKMYKNEDVSVGAWLAGLHIKYIHDPRFDTEYKSRGCSNQYIVTHKQTEADLIHKFETIRDKGYLCSKEFRIRGSYGYDWAALPSKCCVRSNATKIP